LLPAAAVVFLAPSAAAQDKPAAKPATTKAGAKPKKKAGAASSTKATPAAGTTPASTTAPAPAPTTTTTAPATEDATPPETEETTATPVSARLASTPPYDDDARYQWIDRKLADLEGSTQRWFTGWTWTYAFLAVGQGSLALAAPTSDQRALAGVGAVQAALGFGAMVTFPNTSIGAREQLRKMDATTNEGKFERRRRAEYHLAAVAAEEKFEHSGIPIALATAVNLGAGAVLWRGYGMWGAGAAILGAGTVVTLAQVYTRPYKATHAWEQYKKDYSPNAPAEVPPDQIMLFVGMGPTGVVLNGIF
jgi:hypothetical protein